MKSNKMQPNNNNLSWSFISIITQAQLLLGHALTLVLVVTTSRIMGQIYSTFLGCTLFYSQTVFQLITFLEGILMRDFLQWQKVEYENSFVGTRPRYRPPKQLHDYIALDLPTVGQNTSAVKHCTFISIEVTCHFISSLSMG